MSKVAELLNKVALINEQDDMALAAGGDAGAATNVEQGDYPIPVAGPTAEESDMGKEITDYLGDKFGGPFTVNKAAFDNTYYTFSVEFDPEIPIGNVGDVAAELADIFGAEVANIIVAPNSITITNVVEEAFDASKAMDETKIDEATKKVVSADGTVKTVTIKPHRVKKLKHKRKKLSAAAKASRLKKFRLAMAKRKKLGL